MEFVFVYCDCHDSPDTLARLEVLIGTYGHLAWEGTCECGGRKRVGELGVPDQLLARFPSVEDQQSGKEEWL